MNRVKAWVDENLKGDPVIWAVIFALSLISILVVYSATGTLAFKRMVNPESYLIKHTLLVGLGVLAMWVAHKVDYRYYSKLSRFALWLSVPLLIYTFTNGVSLNDASRWIQLPVINASFQPSDLASLALITSLASMLSKRQQNIADFKESLIPILIWCGVICGLI
ncbi:FtsW/RodA/SpoVE family cell cycle protein, partial [Fulvivirga sp.]